MEEEDCAMLEAEESVGTQGESLADGVGVIEVAASSNKLGLEANQEERPTMLKQVTREEGGEHVGGGEAMLTERGGQVA